MTARSPWPAIVFSCVGHFYFHYFTAMYFTVVVALTVAWELPFHELITLWTAGSVLVGLGALPAGRLADSWSATGMMVILFLGMGAFMTAAGFAGDPFWLALALAGMGLFGAIYHPVGIPWMIRHTDGHTGKWLALNGLFGGLGSAAAGGATALLIALGGWQTAFLLPGVLCVATGLAMLWAVSRGWVGDEGVAQTQGAMAPGAADAGGLGQRLRLFAMLLICMFVMGLIYHSLQATMPKLFTERLGAGLAGDAVGAGLLVSIVYGIAAFVQLIGGWIADRYPVKIVYLGAWIAQTVLVALVADSAGLPLFAAALLMAAVGTGALPAENMLLYRHAPDAHKSLAFGIKFVLSFGAGPISIWLIAAIREATGDFTVLFLGLAALAAVATAIVLALPVKTLPARAVPAE